MFTKIPSQQIFIGDYGWHTGRFHFSFADYNDPENTQFGDLVAFNDFLLQPNSDLHSFPTRRSSDLIQDSIPTLIRSWRSSPTAWRVN